MSRVLATKPDSLSLVPRPHTAVVAPGEAPGEESSVRLGSFLSASKPGPGMEWPSRLRVELD